MRKHFHLYAFSRCCSAVQAGKWWNIPGGLFIRVKMTLTCGDTKRYCKPCIEKVVYKPPLWPPEFFFGTFGLFFKASVLFIIHNVFCTPSPFIPCSLTFRKRWTAWQLCLYRPRWSNASTCSSTCLTWPRPLWYPHPSRLRHHHQPPRRRPQARATASRSFPWLTAGCCSRKSSSR